jgi:hypothetical protein
MRVNKMKRLPRSAREAGVSGIVIMSIRGRERTMTVEHNAAPYWYNDPVYRRPWGAWGRGWNSMWESETVRTDVNVLVETRVYSIEQDKLLWSGSSSTLNPESSADVIRGLAVAVTSQLEKSGVLTR